MYSPQGVLGESWRGVSFLPNGEGRPSYRNQRIYWFFHTSARDCVLLSLWHQVYELCQQKCPLHLFPFFLLFFLLWSHKGKLVCRVEGRGEWGSHSRFIRGDFGMWDNVMRTRTQAQKETRDVPCSRRAQRKQLKGENFFPQHQPKAGIWMKSPLHLLTDGAMSVQLRIISIKP